MNGLKTKTKEVIKKMNENYHVGQTVYFFYKGSNREAKIVRVNQKTLSIVSGELKGRIGYGIISTKPSTAQTSECYITKRTQHKTQRDLENLTEEVKQEFSHIFDSIFNEREQELLKEVTITWGKQYTYRRLGTYYHSNNDSHFSYGKIKTNFIRISRSLQIAPNFVVKKTIYHELLHIKFHGHGTEFRRYEKKYPRFQEANIYEANLCREIRQYGMERIFKIPITKEEITKDVEDDTQYEHKRNLTDKEKIIITAKKFNLFPHYMNEDSMDKFDYKFLEMKIIRFIDTKIKNKEKI